MSNNGTFGYIIIFLSGSVDPLASIDANTYVISSQLSCIFVSISGMTTENKNVSHFSKPFDGNFFGHNSIQLCLCQIFPFCFLDRTFIILKIFLSIHSLLTANSTTRFTYFRYFTMVFCWIFTSVLI
jgi:hypothetical protein